MKLNIHLYQEATRYKKPTSETIIKNKIETLNTININNINDRMLETGMDKKEIDKLRNKSVRALNIIEKVYNEKVYQAQNDKMREKTRKIKITKTNNKRKQEQLSGLVNNNNNNKKTNQNKENMVQNFSAEESNLSQDEDDSKKEEEDEEVNEKEHDEEKRDDSNQRNEESEAEAEGEGEGEDEEVNGKEYDEEKRDDSKQRNEESEAEGEVKEKKEEKWYKEPISNSLTKNNKNDNNSTVNINKLYSRMLEMKLSNNENLAKLRKKTVRNLKDFEIKYNEKIYI